MERLAVCRERDFPTHHRPGLDIQKWAEIEQILEQAAGTCSVYYNI